MNPQNIIGYPTFLYLWMEIKNDYTRSMSHGWLSTLLSILICNCGFRALGNLHFIISLTYFIADLYYTIVNKHPPLYIVHHIASIYMMMVISQRDYYIRTNALERVLFIEYSNYFMMLWVQDKKHVGKWVGALINFIWTRVIYLNILLLQFWKDRGQDRLWDETILTIAFPLVNLWWVYRMLVRNPF